MTDTEEKTNTQTRGEKIPENITIETQEDRTKAHTADLVAGQ